MGIQKGFQSFTHNLVLNCHHLGNVPLFPPGVCVCVELRRDSSSSSSSSSSSPVNSQKITAMLQSPAVKFITHPEFFTVLHANYVSTYLPNGQL